MPIFNVHYTLANGMRAAVEVEAANPTEATRKLRDMLKHAKPVIRKVKAKK